MYACLIIVICCRTIVSLHHYQVVGNISQGLEFYFALICCHDLGFARSQGGLILADLFPSN